MQQTNIGWTDFSDPVYQLFNQSRVGIVRQRTKKFLYVSIILAAVAAPAGGNKVQPYRGAAFNDGNNVIYRVGGPLAIGAKSLPKLKQYSANIGIDRSHASGACVDNAFDPRSVVFVLGVSLALNGCVTRLAPSAAPVIFSNPVAAFVAPMFVVQMSTFAFRKRGPGRAMIRESAGAANRLESITARAITRKHFNRKPVGAFATSFQARASKAQVFISRKSDSAGGDL